MLARFKYCRISNHVQLLDFYFKHPTIFILFVNNSKPYTVETQMDKQKEPLSRKIRLKAQQLLQTHTQDWRSYTSKGQQVYIIDDQSFCKIRENVQSGTKCNIENINHCVLIKSSNKNLEQYSQKMLVQGLSPDSPTPGNRVKVISEQLNFLIFHNLGCSGEQISRTVVQHNEGKHVELYPKFIGFQVLQPSKLKNMPTENINQHCKMLQPSQKYKLRYRQKQKSVELYQTIKLLIGRNAGANSTQFKIYLYNPSLFKRIKYERKLSYYLNDQDIKNIASADQRTFYSIINNKKQDEFVAQFFPGRLIKKQQTEVALKESDNLVVELFQDGKWVFPKQQQDSILKRCDFCDLFAQLYLKFRCYKCNQVLMFCTRVCHYQSLIAHLCVEGKRELAKHYGSQIQIDLPAQTLTQKKQRKNTDISGSKDLETQTSSTQHSRNIPKTLNQQKSQLSTASGSQNNFSFQALSNPSKSENNKSVPDPVKNVPRVLVTPPPAHFQNLTAVQLQAGSHSNAFKQGKWGGGIVNLGNTCYMNASLQAIARTDLARVVMSMKSFVNMPMVKAFDALLRHLERSSQKYPVSMKNIQYFKDTIDQYLDLFQGYEQQDAHQFLMSLLDKIHDELNRNAKPINLNTLLSLHQHPNVFDEQHQARVQWIEYISKHNSPITDMFYGQQMEATQCPHCHHKSTKFAPYSSISCSIQQLTQMHWFYVYYQPLNFAHKLSRTQISAKGTVANLLALLKTRIKTSQQPQKIFRLYITGFEGECKQIDNSIQLSQLTKQVALGKGNEKEFKLFVFESYHSSPSVLVFRFCLKDKSFTFKKPFFFKQHYSELTSKQLYQAAFEYFKGFMKNYLKTSEQDKLKLILQKMSENLQNFFSLSLHHNKATTVQGKTKFQQVYNLQNNNGKLSEKCELADKNKTNEVWLQLKEPSNMKPASSQEKAQFHFYDLIIEKFNKYVTDNKSITDTQLAVKLEDCLKQEYNKKTVLDQKNLWHCTICNQKRRAHLSSALYTAGQYLIIHIKRFKKNNVGNIYQKNTAKLSIPFELNLEGLLLKPNSPSSYYSNLTPEEKSALRVEKLEPDGYSSYLFSLKGIIFHQGNIQKGHYISTVLQEQEWIEFNDSESQVVEIEAYLKRNLQKVYVLVYERSKRK